MASDKVLQLAEKIEQLSPDGQALVSKVLQMCIDVDNRVADDQINISWHIEDVKSIAKDLTEDECREVLQRAKHDHDATIGINWDVLEHHAREVRNERT